MTAKKKRRDIQLLRAISVVAVLIFHLNPEWLPGGYLGVDVFFVISGYLITGIFLKEGESFSLTGFYQRRVVRLFPALLVVLLTVLIFTVTAMQPIDYLDSIRALVYSSLQGANFYFAQGTGYFEGGHQTSPLLHTWSLGVEEQFYLVWAPVFFWFFKRSLLNANQNQRLLRGIAWLGLAGIILDLVLKLTEPKAAFYLPMPRSWELMTGAALAINAASARANESVNERGVPIAWMFGGILIIGSLFFGSSYGMFDFLSRIVACAGAALCLKCHANVTHWLFKPVVYVGDISYSLYLWHWPVITFAALQGISPGKGLVSSLCLAAVSLILGAASYHFIEKFGMRRYSRRGFACGLLVAMAVLAIASGALDDSKDSRWRVSPTYRIPSRPIPAGIRQIDRMRINGKPVESCLLKSPAKDVAILIGDSHAGHFIPLVEWWSESKDLVFETYLRPAHLSFSEHIRHKEIDPDGSIAKNRTFEERSKFLREYLQKADYITHVFIAHRTAYYVSEAAPNEMWQMAEGVIESTLDSSLDSHEAYRSEFVKFVDMVTGLGKKVVLLGQAPPLKRLPNYNVTIFDRFKERVAGQPVGKLGNEDLILDKDAMTRLDFETQLYERLASVSGVQYFPTRRILNQPVDGDGNLLYLDDDHLNPLGAKLLLPHLIELVD